MTKTFRTDSGRRLAYTVRGTGDPVVLLSGGPGIDPEAYFAGTSLGEFTHVVLHPRGTADSDAPTDAGDYRMRDHVLDLEELRRHLRLDQLTLYGSSHGASIALGYATTYAAHVDRMVLSGGPARMDQDFMLGIAAARSRFETDAPNGAARLAASDAAAIQLRAAQSEMERQAATRSMIDTYVARPTAGSAAFLDALAHAPMNSAAIGPMIAEMTGGLDLLSESRAIRASTLVVTGDLDIRVPAEHMELIANALPRAELLRLRGGGHLSHVDRSQAWRSSMASFLGGLRPQIASSTLT